MPDEPDIEDEGTPRWVKVFALVAIVVVVLAVVALALSDGDHGPGRHAPLRSPWTLADADGPKPSGPAPDPTLQEVAGGGRTPW